MRFSPLLTKLQISQSHKGSYAEGKSIFSYIRQSSRYSLDFVRYRGLTARRAAQRWSVRQPATRGISGAAVLGV